MVLRNVSFACATDGGVIVRDLCLGSGGRAAAELEQQLPHHVVLPGLVNAHDHLHQNGVPPLPQTAPFRNSYEWDAAFCGHLQDPTVKAALTRPLHARLWHGGLKNALSGVTTVTHHDPAHDAFEARSFPVRVSQPYTWAHSLRQRHGPSVAASFCAAPAQIPWFIHLAEGTDTLAAGELQELRQLGCLGGNTVLIHAVGLGDADVEDIVSAGAGVVWCPSSNLSLLGRTIAPHRLRALFDAGCLALDTDSRLTGARDLLAELQVAAAYSNFTPRELLQVVTVRALRLLRARLRAVIRDGEPVITDPDFADWFAHLRIPFIAVYLDGQPKLCRRDALLNKGVPAWTFEPGLTLQ